MRRALAQHVEEGPFLIENALWLYESWKHIASDDTDLVFMGTPEALQKLPGDVVKVVQRAVADDPDWVDYRFINSLACLNVPGSEALDDYDYLLRSDVDVFLTPAWNRFRPSAFTTGKGQYSNDKRVRENTRRIAEKFCLKHRGIFNIGSTAYGPPQLVKEICALATDLCKYIWTVEFKDDRGEWPSWYAGVSLMYANEIAVNHLVPGFTTTSKKLDFWSWSAEPIRGHPHIHCWHGGGDFSKFSCIKGDYDDLREEDLNLDIVRDYCTAMALRARRGRKGSAPPPLV